MKKWPFLFIIFLCNLSFGSPIQGRKIDPVALAQLSSALDIPKEADIVGETQKRWFCQPNQEQWKIAELSSNQRLFVLNWATEHAICSMETLSGTNLSKRIFL